jgi:hypothetical protein
MLKVAACLSVIIAWTAIACSGDDDPLTQASQYATDPIACAEDSDCCVVNDGCHSTAYLVASKDSAVVASLVASADNSMRQMRDADDPGKLRLRRVRRRANWFLVPAPHGLSR